jgi:hypothetical protein
MTPLDWAQLDGWLGTAASGLVAEIDRQLSEDWLRILDASGMWRWMYSRDDDHYGVAVNARDDRVLVPMWGWPSKVGPTVMAWTVPTDGVTSVTLPNLTDNADVRRALALLSQVVPALDAACIVEGCRRRHQPKKRMCGLHRSRKAKTGDVGDPDVMRHPLPAERLAAMSVRVGDCLIWTGNVNNRGYGKMGFATNDGRRRRNRYAHRVAYEVHVGPIPHGRSILHSCDTPACIEPSHLRPGTQAENGQDVIDRERHPRHLSQAVVADLYARVDAGVPYAAISVAMGLPLGTVTARAWRRRHGHLK